MIGALIKIFRKEKGVGVMELSKKLGINRISLFRIEKGERQPSERTAINAFRELGLSEADIYHIFVFNDLMKRRAISKTATTDEAKLFLKRLRPKDENGRMLHRYFTNMIRKE